MIASPSPVARPGHVAAASIDEDVVAGWTAFLIFGLLIAAVVILGFSLTKRLKNVDRAEEAGLYDPTDKKPRQGVPLRGLAAARQPREQAAAEESGEGSGATTPRPGTDADPGR